MSSFNHNTNAIPFALFLNLLQKLLNIIDPITCFKWNS